MVALLTTMAMPLRAEVSTYGEAYLNGLARDQWQYNDFPKQDAMVCNVNGRMGF